MTVDTILNLGIAALFLGTGCVLYRCCRTPRPASPDQAAAALGWAGTRVWDHAAEAWILLPPGIEPGPGQMTERQLEAADRLELLWLAPAYNADSFAEGRARLLDAMRDEQEGQA